MGQAGAEPHSRGRCIPGLPQAGLGVAVLGLRFQPPSHHRGMEEGTALPCALQPGSPSAKRSPPQPPAWPAQTPCCFPVLLPPALPPALTSGECWGPTGPGPGCRTQVSFLSPGPCFLGAVSSGMASERVPLAWVWVHSCRASRPSSWGPGGLRMGAQGELRWDVGLRHSSLLSQRPGHLRGWARGLPR